MGLGLELEVENWISRCAPPAPAAKAAVAVVVVGLVVAVVRVVRVGVVVAVQRGRLRWA